MKTLLLKVCENVTDAYLIKSMLDDAGINSFIENENSNLVYHRGLNNGVRVVVLEDEFEEARKLLVDGSIPTCPNCGSTFVEFKHTKKNKIIILLMLLIGMIIGVNRKYVCKVCNTEF